LRLALEGSCSEHHRYVLRRLLSRLNHLESQQENLSKRIAAMTQELLAPEKQACLLKVPAVDRKTMENVLAEIGPDMSVFPDERHLSSWTGICPGNEELRNRKGNTLFLRFFGVYLPGRIRVSEANMKPRVSFITLAVEDLERSLRFYRDGLGLPTKGIVGSEFEHGAVAFFEMQHGLTLAIWPRTSLARDTGVPLGSHSATEFVLAYNVTTQAEVDAVMAEALRAGATVTKPPQATFWGGYAGYFQDPDGHLWEVAWNPKMLPEE